jgi:hypothetical protein
VTWRGKLRGRRDILPGHSGAISPDSSLRILRNVQKGTNERHLLLFRYCTVPLYYVFTNLSPPPIYIPGYHLVSTRTKTNRHSLHIICLLFIKNIIICLQITSFLMRLIMHDHADRTRHKNSVFGFPQCFLTTSSTSHLPEHSLVCDSNADVAFLCHQLGGRAHDVATSTAFVAA